MPGAFVGGWWKRALKEKKEKARTFARKDRPRDIDRQREREKETPEREAGTDRHATPKESERACVSILLLIFRRCPPPRRRKREVSPSCPTGSLPPLSSFCLSTGGWCRYPFESSHDPPQIHFRSFLHEQKEDRNNLHGSKRYVEVCLISLNLRRNWAPKTFS